jgi:hypothetical protein
LHSAIGQAGTRPAGQVPAMRKHLALANHRGGSNVQHLEAVSSVRAVLSGADRWHDRAEPLDHDLRQPPFRDSQAIGVMLHGPGEDPVASVIKGCEALRVDPRRASMTALGTSMMRAVHTRRDHPALIDDDWGDRLVTEAERDKLREVVMVGLSPAERAQLECARFAG